MYAGAPVQDSPAAQEASYVHALVHRYPLTPPQLATVQTHPMMFIPLGAPGLAPHHTPGMLLCACRHEGKHLGEFGTGWSNASE